MHKNHTFHTSHPTCLFTPGYWSLDEVCELHQFGCMQPPALSEVGICADSNELQKVLVIPNASDAKLLLQLPLCSCCQIVLPIQTFNIYTSSVVLFNKQSKFDKFWSCVSWNAIATWHGCLLKYYPLKNIFFFNFKILFLPREWTWLYLS